MADPILARQVDAMAFMLVGLGLVGLALYLRLRIFIGTRPGGVGGHLLLPGKRRGAASAETATDQPAARRKGILPARIPALPGATPEGLRRSGVLLSCHGPPQDRTHRSDSA